MKLATWNVNSILAHEDQVLDWVEANEPDILCLQETKVTDQSFPEDAFLDLSYDVEYFGQSSYNGVAIASRERMRDLVRGFPSDGPDADRRLMSACIGNLRVVNVYVPNGQALDSDAFPFKLDWLERLRTFIDEVSRPDQPLVLCGDFNICPEDRDLWNAEDRGLTTHVTPDERSRFEALQDWGLIDALRHFHPDSEKLYTFWDYQGSSFERNRGMRIDHLLVTQPVLTKATACQVDRLARAQKNRSDHAPVVLEIED